MQDGRELLVVGVDSFPGLEKDIGILRCAPNNRVFRRQRPPAMSLHRIAIDHGGNNRILNAVYFRHFVGRAKAIKEMQYRDATVERGSLGDQRHVVGFLHGIGCHHRKTGATGGHHVAVIGKNRQGLRRNRTRGNVKHRGSQLPCNLVHIGQHQQQPLGRGEGGGERAPLQRTMDGSGGARFTLHLNDLRHRAKNIGAALGRPGIRVLPHGGGRGDRINGDNFVGFMGNQGHRLIPINGQEVACCVRHCSLSAGSGHREHHCCTATRAMN